MREVQTRWCHPAHLKYTDDGEAYEGIKGSSLFGGHVRKKLSNQAIHRYALAGYYGLENMVAAQEVEKRKKKRPKS